MPKGVLALFAIPELIRHRREIVLLRAGLIAPSKTINAGGEDGKLLKTLSERVFRLAG